MKRYILIIFIIGFLFHACDYGQLGGADQTGTSKPEETVFEERMAFMSGVWYSHYAGIGRLDSYRICRWSDFNADDRAKAQALFTGIDVDNLKTWGKKDSPKPGDYIFLYDSSIYGEDEKGLGGIDLSSYSGSFMGVVRAINIFNNDINRGAIIIEYFEKTEAKWLERQGIEPGERPFYGIYYRVLEQNLVQMANAIDFAALYAGVFYCTEQKTLEEAINLNTVENEAEFINWGVVIPQDRE
jgi:hypothetical protein